jgi:peptidoglycan/LPS O-acetylase OafA/YrhL
VVPLYLVIVIMSWIFWNTEFAVAPVRGVLLEHLFFVRGSSVLWTIPTEIQFYFVFALLWWILWTRGHIALLMLGIGVVAVSGVAIVATKRLGGDLSYLSFFKCSHFFLMGAGISVLYNRYPSAFRGISASRHAVWLGYGALALCTLSIPGIRTMSGWREIPTWVDPFTIMAVPVFFVAALVALPAFRFLTTKAFRELGRISYSFYLLHAPILAALEKHLDVHTIAGKAFGFLLVVAAVTTAAELSYRFMERPLQRLINSGSLFARRRKVIA